MISLKNLNLNRKYMEDDIEKNARSFFDENSTICIENRGKNKIITISSNLQLYKISVYYLSDGTTSLCTAGSPVTHDLTDSFIQKISQDYCISNKKNISFNIPNITEETFKFLLEYFETEIKASIITKSDAQYYSLIQLKGTLGDLLTIKRYTNGNTQFQGKPLVLYTHLCEFLSDFCSAKEIIDAQQEIYEVEINETETEREFCSRFIKSKNFLEGELKNILYHEERNSIFHVDGGIIDTRIIETREEADSIFEKTVNLIESTYIDMNL